MGKEADLLQERLDRLEAGQALEACQQGLPAQESELLTLVSRLSTVEWPEPDARLVQIRRRRVAEQYERQVNMTTKKEPGYQTLHDWRLWAALSVGIVALFLCGLLASIGIGWLTTSRKHLAISPTTPAVSQAIYPTAQLTQVPTVTVSPGEAILVNLSGQVEVQQGMEWVAAKERDTFKENTRLRTGVLSGATLFFRDGSQVRLGPFTEITIDQLNAAPGAEDREVVLTQWSGESVHLVVSGKTAQAHYEVKTPSSRGLAKGTQFHVRIVSNQTAWYVDQGIVEVTGKDTSVLLEAGKMTTVNPEKKPKAPMNFFSGKGEVSYIGETWVIAGQTFLTHNRTVVIGNPQVGDIVFYEGHLRTDGKPVLDLVVLLRRNPANTFTLTGQVQEMGEKAWRVNNQVIAITDETLIEPGIQIGDLVRVQGLILADGSLQAREIHKVEPKRGTPFDFTGVIQQQGETSWVISGVVVSVNANTRIDEGLAIGDLARAQGWILEDNTWLATSIRRVPDETSSFEITGFLQSMDPWIVAGVQFETREWTEIDAGLAIGDLVHVEGIILSDGTWLASEIRRVGDPQLTILIGRVYSMDPWIVSGFRLNVDEDTEIVGKITIGMLVRVEMLLLPDGNHKVLRIAPVSEFWWWWDTGCHTFIVIVDRVEGKRLYLKGWPSLTLEESVEIKGDLRPGAIILIQICFDEYGNIRIVYIIIIYQPEPPPPPEDESSMVLICHKPNSKHSKTMWVPRSALGGHLGHGDTLGACGGGSKDHDDDNNDD